MQFNETLAKLRKERGYTQEQLAEKLNVSRQAVARWESGETAPDVYILKNICEIFDASASDILNGTPPEPAKVEFIPLPESAEEKTSTKREPSKKTKTAFAAAAVAIVALSVTTNVGMLLLAKAQLMPRSKTDDITLNAQSKLSSLSYIDENSFWTAEEYEKWAEEQLEYYREMYEIGEELWWYTENGDKVCKALTEEDLKSIEKSVNETLKTIVDGDLCTKDKVINWTGSDGKEYSMITEVVYFTRDDQATFESEVSETFLTYDGNVATNEESAATGNSEAGGRSFEEVFEPYKKYGVEYREENGERKLYFNGTAVSKFLDLSPDGGIYVFSSDGGGEISVQTKYNDRGELVGVEEIE